MLWCRRKLGHGFWSSVLPWGVHYMPTALVTRQVRSPAIAVGIVVCVVLRCDASARGSTVCRVIEWLTVQLGELPTMPSL